MAERRRLCLNGLVGEERKAQVYARHTWVLKRVKSLALRTKPHTVDKCQKYLPSGLFGAVSTGHSNAPVFAIKPHL
jgi:hypothetical protein